jgi:hypothetical protein
MFVSLTGTIRYAAWLACAAVLGMIAIFFVTGVGQDPLQFVHPVEEYSALLLHNPAALRATVGLDNLFVLFYTTLFLASFVRLLQAGSPRLLVYASIGCILLLALLDMVENFHFLAMLGRAELGMAPTGGEIELQVWESLLKFHVGYLGVLLFGLAMPRQSRSARLLGDLCVWFQAPVGILIYVTPRFISFPLVFVRFSFFVAALLLSAAAFGGEPAGSDARA